MNVLVLQAELGELRGGGENFTRSVFDAFVSRGHTATAAFAARWNGRCAVPPPPRIQPLPVRGWWPMSPGQRVLSAIGTHLTENGRLKKNWERIQEGLNWRTFRWYRRRFHRRVMKDFGPRWKEFDAVYVHGNALLAADVAEFRPTVLRLPGPVGPELKPVLQRIPAVCANGDALKRVRSFLGNHIRELPVGLDDNLFSPGPSALRRRMGWSDGDYVIGYVGRLVHQKGVHTLAAAFLEAARAVEARLLLVGTGDEEGNLRRVLRTHIAAGTAHIEPGVDHAELPEWYRAMDIFVMPSIYENFSNSLLEAMACGIPFVGSDVGGNQTLAQAAAGLLFEPRSSSRLAERLLEAAGTREALRDRGRCARAYVSGRYSWSITAELLERIFAESISARG